MVEFFKPIADIPWNFLDTRYFTFLGFESTKNILYWPKKKRKKSNMPILCLKGTILKIAYLFSSEIV